MTTTQTHKTNDELLEDILEAVISAGMEPTDEIATARIAEVAEYFRADAYRINQDKSMTLARWNADEAELKVWETTLSGVIYADATFTFGARGVRMFAAAVQS